MENLEALRLEAEEAKSLWGEFSHRRKPEYLAEKDRRKKIMIRTKEAYEAAQAKARALGLATGSPPPGPRPRPKRKARSVRNGNVPSVTPQVVAAQHMPSQEGVTMTAQVVTNNPPVQAAIPSRLPVIGSLVATGTQALTAPPALGGQWRNPPATTATPAQDGTATSQAPSGLARMITIPPSSLLDQDRQIDRNNALDGQASNPPAITTMALTLQGGLLHGNTAVGTTSSALDGQAPGAIAINVPTVLTQGGQVRGNDSAFDPGSSGFGGQVSKATETTDTSSRLVAQGDQVGKISNATATALSDSAGQASNIPATTTTATAFQGGQVPNDATNEAAPSVLCKANEPNDPAPTTASILHLAQGSLVENNALATTIIPPDQTTSSTDRGSQTPDISTGSTAPTPSIAQDSRHSSDSDTAIDPEYRGPTQVANVSLTNTQIATDVTTTFEDRTSTDPAEGVLPSSRDPSNVAPPQTTLTRAPEGRSTEEGEAATITKHISPVPKRHSPRSNTDNVDGTFSQASENYRQTHIIKGPNSTTLRSDSSDPTANYSPHFRTQSLGPQTSAYPSTVRGGNDNAESTYAQTISTQDAQQSMASVHISERVGTSAGSGDVVSANPAAMVSDIPESLSPALPTQSPSDMSMSTLPKIGPDLLFSATQPFYPVQPIQESDEAILGASYRSETPIGHTGDESRTQAATHHGFGQYSSATIPINPSTQDGEQLFRGSFDAHGHDLSAWNAASAAPFAVDFNDFDMTFGDLLGDHRQGSGRHLDAERIPSPLAQRSNSLAFPTQGGVTASSPLPDGGFEDLQALELETHEQRNLSHSPIAVPHPQSAGYDGPSEPKNMPSAIQVDSTTPVLDFTEDFPDTPQLRNAQKRINDLRLTILNLQRSRSEKCEEILALGRRRNPENWEILALAVETFPIQQSIFGIDDQIAALSSDLGKLDDAFMMIRRHGIDLKRKCSLDAEAAEILAKFGRAKLLSVQEIQKLADRQEAISDEIAAIEKHLVEAEPYLRDSITGLAEQQEKVKGPKQVRKTSKQNGAAPGANKKSKKRKTPEPEESELESESEDWTSEEEIPQPPRKVRATRKGQTVQDARKDQDVENDKSGAEANNAYYDGRMPAARLKRLVQKIRADEREPGEKKTTSNAQRGAAKSAWSRVLPLEKSPLPGLTMLEFEELRREGKAQIDDFLREGKIEKLSPSIRRLVRLYHGFLPESSHQTRELAMAIHFTKKGDYKCRFHFRYKYKKDMDAVGNMTEGSNLKPDYTTEEPQGGLMRCGCPIEDALLEFFFYKSWYAQSEDPTSEGEEEGANSMVVKPPVRAFICRNFRLQTYLSVDDVYKWAKSEDTWRTFSSQKHFVRMVQDLRSEGQGVIDGRTPAHTQGMTKVDDSS